MFPGEQQAQIRVQLAAALTGIVYQRLLPRDRRRAWSRRSRCWSATTAVRNLIREGKTRQLRNVAGDRLPRGHADPRAVADRRSWPAGTVDHQTALGASIFPHEVHARRG